MSRTLRRQSQKTRTNWERRTRLACARLCWPELILSQYIGPKYPVAAGGSISDGVERLNSLEVLFTLPGTWPRSAR
jgi:hypothetical protein